MSVAAAAMVIESTPPLRKIAGSPSTDRTARRTACVSSPSKTSRSSSRLQLIGSVIGEGSQYLRCWIPRSSYVVTLAGGTRFTSRYAVSSIAGYQPQIHSLSATASIARDTPGNETSPSGAPAKCHSPSLRATKSGWSPTWSRTT
jgi:hypothetical protein